MIKEILIFGHKNPDTDTICSAMVKERLNIKNGHNNSEAVRLGKINKETQYVLDYLNLEAPRLVEEVEEGQKVILVDHNEFSQSVKGIEKATIIGVVDHHRIANFETSAPLFFTARPYGCTATILFKDYKQKGFEINKEEAILMASSIISDTLLLKSPTTTKTDVKALEELGETAQIDINAYGLELLKAGTNLEDLSADELVSLDAKQVEKEELKYIIAQVGTVNIEDTLKKQEEIEEAINKEIETKGLNLFIFVITDILKNNSEIIVLGEMADVVEKAFEKDLKNNRIFLEGVVSRKKQILPKIDKNI